MASTGGCQIPAFVELYHRLSRPPRRDRRPVTHGLSNALTASVNTEPRLLPRIAYGSAPPTTSSPCASATTVTTAHDSPADWRPNDPRICSESVRLFKARASTDVVTPGRTMPIGALAAASIRSWK